MPNNDGWRTAPENKDSKKSIPLILKKDENPKIPISDDWRLEEKEIPRSQFSSCSLGDAHQIKDEDEDEGQTESEIQTGHATILFLALATEKIAEFEMQPKTFLYALLLICLSVLIVLGLNKSARKREKRAAIRAFEESQVIPVTSMRHEDNIGRC